MKDVNAYQREWRRKNPDKAAAIRKRFRTKHRDRLLEEGATYSQSRRNFMPGRCLVLQAKTRANKKGITFDLPREVEVPDTCPILGIPLIAGKVKHTANSPSLDRIVQSKGYTQGNVQVISYKANTMKSDASPEELLRFADWIQKTYATSLSN